MAVSAAGQLFMWGLSQPLRQRQQGGLREQALPAPLEWLGAARVVGAACATEHAGAHTADGRLLLWGRAAHMPPSLLLQQQQQQPQAARDSAAAAPPQQQPPQASPFAHQAAARLSASKAAGPQCQAPPACSTPAPTRLPSRALGRLPSRALGRSPTPLADPPLARSPAVPQLATRHFSPDHEPVQHVSCGRGHTLLLCRPTLHVPSAARLRAAALAVLQAYVKW
jgi:hypothetical protein